MYIQHVHIFVFISLLTIFIVSPTVGLLKFDYYVLFVIGVLQFA